MPCQRWMEPYLSEPVSQLDPSFPQNPTTATHGTPLRVTANITCDAFSSSRPAPSKSLYVPLSVILSHLATFLPWSAISGAGQTEESERADQNRSRAVPGGCARPAPGHCLILGLRRMPFFTANPQHHQIAPHRTAPHRIARHRTVPHLSPFSGPSPGRDCLLLLLRTTAGRSSAVVASIPQRLT